MLSSGAHIKLGDYEFVIDKSVENHYNHRYYDLTPDKVGVGGLPSGKEGLQPDVLMMVMDDWAGGEGNRIFYTDEYDKYFISGSVNPRVRGQLTASPDLSMRVGSNTFSVQWASRGRIGAGAGYYAMSRWSTIYFYSGSGAFAVNQIFDDPINCIAGTSERIVVGTGSGNSGSTAGAYYNVGGGWVPLTATGGRDVIGVGNLDDNIYSWNGYKLLETTMPYAHGTDPREVYILDEGYEPPGAYSPITGGMVEAEGALIPWTSEQVHIFKDGVGAPLWKPPHGMYLTDVLYQNGNLFCIGSWGDGLHSSSLYAVDMNSYTPYHVKWIGGPNIGPSGTSLGHSFGDQILIGTDSDKVYVYDADSNGLSVLGEAPNTWVIDGNTYVIPTLDIHAVGTAPDGYRIAAISSSGAPPSSKVLTHMAWKSDAPTSRDSYLFDVEWDGVTSTTPKTFFSVTSPLWDFNFPTEVKALHGFHVAFDPLVAGQTILIEYSINGTDWTALDPITSATPGATPLGRVYITVSTPASLEKFYTLQFRASLGSAFDVLSPILYAIGAEARLVRKREEWELIVRLKDEQSRERPSNRQVPGPTIRDWLLDQVGVGSVVTLLDGYRYHGANQYTTHSVNIKEINDVISEPGEGDARILLVANTEEETA